MSRRTLLPGDFETRYKSEGLKEQISEISMWSMIPAVTYSMESKKGIRRLEKHHLLFEFIDEHFGNDSFAFEPNMQDDRFVFIPQNVSHQGIGICVCDGLPGFLEVGHFWYPGDYSKKRSMPIGMGQVYVPMFRERPDDELVDMVRRIYMKKDRHEQYCTFPFSPKTIVTLKGNFMDHLPQSIKTIREAVQGQDPVIVRNAEGLINFMEQRTHTL